MSHFAQLGLDNTVLQVIVVNNNDITDANGVESEAAGIAICKQIHGEDTRWVQTSYNATFRKNYAVIGGTYDASRDAFIPPKPHPSWVLHDEFFVWEAPVPYPDVDGVPHYWDEAKREWVRIES
jgi:hypothetical protein